jgi:hypothetical protein
MAAVAPMRSIAFVIALLPLAGCGGPAATPFDLPGHDPAQAAEPSFTDWRELWKNDGRRAEDAGTAWAVALVLAVPTTCRLAMDVEGYVPTGRIPATIGSIPSRWLDNSGVPVVPVLTVGNETVFRDDGFYDSHLEVPTLHLEPGTAWVFFAAMGPGRLDATVGCNEPFQVGGRMRSDAVDLPRTYVFDGAAASMGVGGLGTGKYAWDAPGHDLTLVGAHSDGWMSGTARDGAGHAHAVEGKLGGPDPVWDDLEPPISVDAKWLDGFGPNFFLFASFDRVPAFTGETLS